MPANVVYTPSGGESVVVPEDTSAACAGGAQGWQYTEGPDTKLRLCGQSCDKVRGDAGGRVDVVLGCPSVVLL